MTIDENNRFHKFLNPLKDVESYPQQFALSFSKFNVLKSFRYDQGEESKYDLFSNCDLFQDL